MGLSSRLSSWKLVLVSGVTYDVARFAIKFTANGKNTAQLDMAIGNNTHTGQTQNFALQRGKAASVYILDADDDTGALKGGEIFKGYVLDFGPSTLQYGSYGFTVTLQGVSSYLASGTLQNSGIIPSSYLDNSVQMWASAADASGTAQSVGTGEINRADAYTSGFLPALRESLAVIAEGLDTTPNPITAQIRLLFNASTNTPASKILRGLSGDESAGTIGYSGGYPSSGNNGGGGLKFRTQTYGDQLCYGICTRVSELMRTDWQYASFYDRLLSIGTDLMFSVVETSNKVWCVPYVPFFPTNKVRRIISADQYSDIAVANQPPIPIVSGSVLMNCSGSQAIQTGAALIRATYTRSNVPTTVYNPGQVIVASIPPLLAMSAYSGAAGNTADPADCHDVTGNIPDVTAAELAKVVAWTAAYRPFRLVVTCPYLRDDIAPLTSVRVDFPGSAEIGTSMTSPAVYGSVQSVTLRGDASQQFAQTQLEIGYVRSYNQQNQEINSDYNGHPLWSRNWYGCDLYGADVLTAF